MLFVLLGKFSLKIGNNMSTSQKFEAEQEWASALREIGTNELREATLALGLKLGGGTVDLTYQTFCAQLNTALERFQAANMDITAFVLLKDMLDQTKREILTLKHSTYLALAQLLQYREQEDFAAFQKRQQNNAKRRKKNEEMNVAAAAAAVVKKENV
jgi:hypothetical protein